MADFACQRPCLHTTSIDATTLLQLRGNVPSDLTVISPTTATNGRYTYQFRVEVRHFQAGPNGLVEVMLTLLSKTDNGKRRMRPASAGTLVLVTYTRGIRVDEPVSVDYPED